MGRIPIRIAEALAPIRHACLAGTLMREAPTQPYEKEDDQNDGGEDQEESSVGWMHEGHSALLAAPDARERKYEGDDEVRDHDAGEREADPSSRLGNAAWRSDLDFGQIAHGLSSTHTGSIARLLAGLPGS